MEATEEDVMIVKVETVRSWGVAVSDCARDVSTSYVYLPVTTGLPHPKADTHSM